MSNTALMEKRLARLERAQIEQSELDALGHRVIYDTTTGVSRNLTGCRCRPDCLDAHGYQIRYEGGQS